MPDIEGNNCPQRRGPESAQGAIPEARGLGALVPAAGSPFPCRPTGACKCRGRQGPRAPRHRPHGFNTGVGQSSRPSATGARGPAPMIPATTSSATLTPLHRLNTSQLISVAPRLCYLYLVFLCLQNQIEREQAAANTQ